MSTIHLADLLKMHAAAPDGEWMASEMGPAVVIIAGDKTDDLVATFHGEGSRQDDMNAARFVAAAVNALPALIAEVLALREVKAIAEEFVPKCEETTYDAACGESFSCEKRATHMDRFLGLDNARLCAEHAELALASAKKAESKGHFTAMRQDAPRKLEADERIDRLEEALAKVPK